MENKIANIFSFSPTEGSQAKIITTTVWLSFWFLSLVFIFLFLIFSPSKGYSDDTYVSTHEIGPQQLACPSMRRHIGAQLLHDTCWDAMFPIEVGDFTIHSGHEEDDPNPDEESSSAYCCCNRMHKCSSPEDYLEGSYGWVWKWWEIDRIVEVVRVPWCFPSLGGADGEWGFWLPAQLNPNWGEVNKIWGGFQATDTPEKVHHFFNVHFYAYAPLAFLEILIAPECHAGFIMDFDLLEASEFDFSWAREGFGWFAPDTILFANPVAVLACTADCALSNVGFGNNYLFWCAGCLGSIYPVKGNVNYQLSPTAVAELMLYRWLFKMFRTGKEFKTWDVDDPCRPQLWPFFIIKNEFKLQMIHPMVEKGDPCVHPLGRSPFLWGGSYNVSGVSGGLFPGEAATVAGVGEDYVYYLWRRMECCIR